MPAGDLVGGNHAESRTAGRGRCRAVDADLAHARAWLLFLAQKAGQVVQVRFPACSKGNASEFAFFYSLHMVILYTLVGLLLFAISWSA